jgi:hypothetical protein
MAHLALEADRIMVAMAELDYHRQSPELLFSAAEAVVEVELTTRLLVETEEEETEATLDQKL